MADARARLIECFAAVFPELSEAEIPSASTTTVAEWDSMAAVSLVSVIEEQFGVRVGSEDLVKLTSFERILSWLGDRPEAG